MAKFNASRLKVLIGSVALTHQESAELNISAETIDVTTMDSNGWRELLHGLKSWSLSGSGILDFAATEGVEEIFGDLIAGAPVNVKFTTSLTGDSEWSGSAYYSELTVSSTKEDKVAFNYTLQGTGPLTMTTIS